jgi:hypothetical protein
MFQVIKGFKYRVTNSKLDVARRTLFSSHSLVLDFPNSNSYCSVLPIVALLKNDRVRAGPVEGLEQFIRSSLLRLGEYLILAKENGIQNKIPVLKR